MSPHDFEFGEFKGHLINVGDGPPRLGRTERAGMADLAAEWNPKVDTLGVKGVIAPVGRGEVPVLLDNSQALEAKLTHAAPELSNAIHRPVQINRRDTDKAVRMRFDNSCHLVVGYGWPVRPPPGTN